MKKAYLITCLILTGFVSGQTINFPDANFKAKLLEANSGNMIALDEDGNHLTLDANNNGEIEISETLYVYALNVSNANISDLTGISNFLDLMSLNCSHNALTNIVIDHSIDIISLDASHNDITAVDINYYVFVEWLDLSYNSLTSFVASDNYFADNLNLSHNQLTSVTLENATFTYVTLDYNNLTSIQFNGNVSIVSYISAGNNLFTLLEFPANVYFNNESYVEFGNNVEDRLYFHGSQPGNVSYMSNNTWVDFGNLIISDSCDPENQGFIGIQYCPNLTQVILKNGIVQGNITCNEGGTGFEIPPFSLGIAFCPSLTHICVDEGEEAAVQVMLNNLGLQNQVQVNSNCTSSVLETVVFTLTEQFTIFPVPVQNILQIQSNENLEIIGMEVYNSLGQLVQKEVGNQKNIEVSGLASGSYYLKIKTDNLNFIKKFLKE